MPATTAALTAGTGTVQLHSPWGTAATGQILVNGAAATTAAASDPVGGWKGRAGSWHLGLEELSPGITRLALTHTGPEITRLETVHFARWDPAAFTPSLPTAAFRELVHGGSFRGMDSGAKCVGRPTAGLGAVVPGSMFTVFQREDGTALLLGVLPPLGQAFSELVTLHDEAHLEGTFGVEIRHRFDCDVEPGTTLHTSGVVALSGAGGTDLMAAYGALWRQRLQRPQVRRPMIGWNSWDFYSGAVTRRDMDENLDAAAPLLGEGPHALVIDEGWEQQWGIWEPNAKFDGDLEAYCRHVRHRGWIPGIWTAPLLVNTYSPLYLERPAWFAAGADGQVRTDTYSYGPMAYLDVTRPEVLDHIEGIFRRLRETGFEYFKVDFCHCILSAQRFHDRRVGRAELIRRAFAVIRRAIGASSYLLSCGAPYESVAGLVDAVRSTGDIHIYWGHVLRNAAALSAHWWMQGSLWNCDPDFLVVRGPDTAHPPFGRRQVVTPLGLESGWLAGREFNRIEARTYALLVHLSGGDVILSDPLGRLRPEGREILRAVCTPRDTAAVPVDLFETEQDLPRIWISRGDQDTLVGLFNWSDKPARIDFDPGAFGLQGDPVDFWSGRPCRSLPLRMGRRSSVALRYPAA